MSFNFGFATFVFPTRAAVRIAHILTLCRQHPHAACQLGKLIQDDLLMPARHRDHMVRLNQQTLSHRLTFVRPQIDSFPFED